MKDTENLATANGVRGDTSGNTPPLAAKSGEAVTVGSIAAQDRAQINTLQTDLALAKTTLGFETTNFANKLTVLNGELSDQISKVVERDALLVKHAQGIRDRDAQIGDLAKRLKQHSEQLAQHIEDVKARDSALLAHAQTIRERDAKIVSLEAQLQEHSVQLASHIAMVKERDAKLSATQKS